MNEAWRKRIVHHARMSRGLAIGRRFQIALLAAVVLLALAAADWWQQKREYVQLVDRISHALAVTDGFLNLGIESDQEAALMQKTLPAEFAKLEQVTVLPWHRDLRAARTASVELGAAWTAVATQTLKPEAFPAGYDPEAETVPIFGAMRDRLTSGKPVFTDYYWGTIFP